MTFNTKWYGLGGELEGSPRDEYRDRYLRKFFQEEVPQADVYVFQEVVDVLRVNRGMIPETYSCMSYAASDEKHQHVVVCAAPHLRFVSEPNDNNDIIEEVAGGSERARPAVHVIIADESGRSLARVVGVHLKAYIDKSNVREQQAKAIAKFLRGVADPSLPTVITGDFNTYPATQTGRREGDEEMISRIFKSQGLGLAQVPNPSSYTFRTHQFASRFDHFWVSGASIETPLWVYSACNLESMVRPQYDSVESYNQHISDHCPVAVRLGL